MGSKLICVTKAEEGLDTVKQSGLDVEFYSDARSALEAYEENEGAAILTDFSHGEITEEIGEKESEAPVFSSETSNYFGDLSDLLKGSYDKDLMREEDFDIYGLAPTINHGIENSPVGVTAAIRDENGQHPIFYVNEGFEEITGYDRSNALGRDCSFLQGEDTDQDEVALIREALDNKEPIRKTVMNYTADGQEFWNELEIWPVEIGNHDVFLGYQRDVTERETYKQDLELVMRILRHDLRNDQTVMEGHLGLLKDELEQELGEIPRELKVIEERLGSLGSKVDKLEQMKNTGNVEREGTMDLYEKVRTTAFDYGQEAESEGFTIEVEDPERDVIVENRSHLDEYFGNIYENSIEHYPDNENDGEIKVNWNFEADSVEVEISDNGRGMETNRENWGVGLFTINRIANMEDIEMELESDEGLTVKSRFDIIENE